jgi:hypothetical protein
VERLGIPDIFLEHGPQALLREKYGIDEDGIMNGVRKMFEEERSGSASTNQSETSENQHVHDAK